MQFTMFARCDDQSTKTKITQQLDQKVKTTTIDKVCTVLRNEYNDN